jgi:hypothetical protein
MVSECAGCEAKSQIAVKSPKKEIFEIFEIFLNISKPIIFLLTFRHEVLEIKISQYLFFSHFYN